MRFCPAVLSKENSMTDKLIAFFAELALWQKYLGVSLISMVPLIELRGAIPVGIGIGLPVLPTYIICVLANMVPVPIIFFFARRVLEWGAKLPRGSGFFKFFLEKGHKGGEKLKAAAGGGKGLFVALALFVGIPLPGTGAWTGILAASLLDMDFKESVIACMLGVLLAGIIMGLVSAGLFGALQAVL